MDAWNNLSALWTMSAFGIFYLLAPFFHKIMNTYKRACAIALVAIGTGTIFTQVLCQLAEKSRYAKSLNYLSGKSPVAVLYVFLIGGLIYLYTKDRQKNERGGYFLLIVAVWSLVYGHSGVTIVVVFALILEFVQSKYFVFKDFFGVVLIALDNYSYDIYLAHTTCLNLFAKLRYIYNLNTGTIVIGSVLSTIVLTLFLHNIIDIRFWKKIANWILQK